MDGVSGPSAFIMRQYIGRNMGFSATNEKQTAEAIGLRPGKVTYRVALSAAWELKKPK
jgi:hypothetical protein